MTNSPETEFVDVYEPGREAKVELRNGRLVDVENGGYFDPGVTVVLQNGKIDFMPGMFGEDMEFKADYTIDLGGRAIIPSLFNTHCHMMMNSPTMVYDFIDLRIIKKNLDQQIIKTMKECLAHGITNIRDAFTEDMGPQQDVIDRISSGEIAGPRIQKAVAVGPPGSYIVEKHSFALKLVRSTLGLPTMEHAHPDSGTIEFPVDASEQQVRDAVDRAIDDRGAEAIKIGEQLEDMTTFKPDLLIMKLEQMEAIADQARKRGLQSTIHQVSAATFRRAVKAGVSSLAHLALDEVLTQEDIDAFLAAGTILEPTLTLAYDFCWKIEGDPLFDNEAMGVLSHYRAKIATFEDLGIDFYIEKFHKSLNRSMKKLSSGKIKMLGFIPITGVYQYYSRYASNGFENFINLFKNGATMALANDGGIAPGTAAMMGLELRLFDLFLDKMANLGSLKGIDAIRIGTLNSARSLGVDRDFGSIETGKVGDLVVLDGDPLEDASLIGGRAAAVFKDGELIINNCGLEVKKRS